MISNNNKIITNSNDKYIKQIRERIDTTSDINERDIARNAILHYVVQFGSIYMIQMILDAGGNINLPNGNNYTPLMLAKMYNRPQTVIEYLISNGAK